MMAGSGLNNRARDQPPNMEEPGSIRFAGLSIVEGTVSSRRPRTRSLRVRQVVGSKDQQARGRLVIIMAENAFSCKEHSTLRDLERLPSRPHSWAGPYPPPVAGSALGSPPRSEQSLPNLALPFTVTPTATACTRRGRSWDPSQWWRSMPLDWSIMHL